METREDLGERLGGSSHGRLQVGGGLKPSVGVLTCQELLHEVDQNGDGSIDFEVQSLLARVEPTYIMIP